MKISAITLPCGGMKTSMVYFQQKYWGGKSENRLFSLFIKKKIGSKYPENFLFHYEKRSPDDGLLNGYDHLVASVVEGLSALQ